jgi:hypothetical protein
MVPCKSLNTRKNLNLARLPIPPRGQRVSRHITTKFRRGKASVQFAVAAAIEFFNVMIAFCMGIFIVRSFKKKF